MPRGHPRTECSVHRVGDISRGERGGHKNAAVPLEEPVGPPFHFDVSREGDGTRLKSRRPSFLAAPYILPPVNPARGASINRAKAAGESGRARKNRPAGPSAAVLARVVCAAHRRRRSLCTVPGVFQRAPRIHWDYLRAADLCQQTRLLSCVREFRAICIRAAARERLCFRGEMSCTALPWGFSRSCVGVARL